MPQGRPTKVFAALDRAESAPDVEGLTAEFKKAHEAFMRCSVEAMRRLGGLLADGSEKLSGSYSKWVRDDLGISLSTARNYRSLHDLGLTAPKFLEANADLGPTKLFRLARIPKKDRSKALSALGARAREMTDAEVAVALRPYVASPSTAPRAARTSTPATVPTPTSPPGSADALRKGLRSIAGYLKSASSLPVAPRVAVRKAVLTDIASVVSAATVLQRRWAVRATTPVRPSSQTSTPAKPSTTSSPPIAVSRASPTKPRPG